MKLIKYISFLAILTVFTTIHFPKEVSAEECPFDSYIIIGGQCHNLTEETSTPTVYKTVYRSYDSQNEVDDLTNASSTKKCSDFKYQEYAQAYFDKYLEENKAMDIDRDGYACDHLTRINRDILTVAIWHELLNENIARKSATKNKEALTYNEVIRIIGFPPNASRNGRIIWEDPINNMAIKIRFHRQQIYDMKGIGF